MNKNGSKDIVERGKKTQFKRGDPAAVEAQKKSVRIQKEKRTMRKTMRLLSQTTLTPGEAFDLAKAKNFEELKDKNLTIADLIAYKIVKGAKDGDPECRRLYLELTGAMDKEKDVGGNDVVRVIIDV